MLPEQVRVLQTYWPLELHTQVLQSTVVNVPGVQLVDTCGLKIEMTNPQLKGNIFFETSNQGHLGCSCGHR